MIKRFLAIGFLAALAMVMAACGSTYLVKTWKDDAFHQGPLNRILVVGVGKDEAARRSFEKLFAKELGEEGVSAKAGYMLIPDEKNASADKVLAAANQAGMEAVFVTTYLGMKKQVEYVAPPASPGGATFGPYYSRTYMDVHAPGYYKTRQYVQLESKLYTVPGGKLVWSARSDTIEQANMANLVKSLADSMARKLRADGLIGPKAPKK